MSFTGKKLRLDHSLKLKLGRMRQKDYLEIDRKLAEEDRQRFLNPQRERALGISQGSGYIEPDYDV